MFAVATAAATPKLLIAIFIGSRLAVIAKSGEKMDTGTKVINWASIIFGAVLGGVTGWLIYRRCVNSKIFKSESSNTDLSRTLARSQEIEAEERAGVRRPGSQAGEFSDEVDEQAATATLIKDDQIDFLDREDATEGYRDEYTDDEDDVFRYGDGDEEEGAIGLDKQPPQR